MSNSRPAARTQTHTLVLQEVLQAVIISDILHNNADTNNKGLTVASQDEVLVQVLLEVLTAGPEGLSAEPVSPELLLGELLAGHAFWDVPHAGFTAVLHRPETLRWTDGRAQRYLLTVTVVRCGSPTR